MTHQTNHTARLTVLRRLAWQAFGSGNAGDVARIQRYIEESKQIVRRDRAPVEFPAVSGSWSSLRACGRAPV